ncbi:MAG: rod shape-determining protein RodA [Candidatus Wildermuthbacteria bacterium]|nr:rod shape-determining protein RodA [Candidatus Wildermuthbacteria bacterium]
MKAVLHHFKNYDWMLLGSAMLLVAFGLLSLYSFSMGRGDFSIFFKQLVFFGISFFAMVLVSFLDWRLIRNNPYLILVLYGIGIAALIGLLLFVEPVRGIRGWYQIAGISLNPIEYVKIILVILMAKYFSTRHIEAYRLRHIILSGLYFALPVILIFQQPDFGSAAILAVLWLVTLLVAGIPFKYFLTVIALGAIVLVLGWSFALQEYQKDRIRGFLDPSADPQGIGWSPMQSKIAIGNGGIWGQGLGEGTQTQYGFLSEPHTDFIFAAIGEEFGLAGILILFVLFILFLGRVLKIGSEAASNFPRLFAVGFAILLMFQIIVNVGMNLGLLPIVGLPLPFLSYGGSSLLMLFLGIGILQSVKTH